MWDGHMRMGFGHGGFWLLLLALIVIVLLLPLIITGLSRATPTPTRRRPAMYGFSVELDAPFAAAVERTIEALKTQGFGVLCDIDVAATLKEKLDIESRPYRILGACNPPLAHRALEAEPDIGLLLPCNVVVQQLGEGRSKVSFMDPGAVLGLVDNERIEPIAAEVGARLRAVRDALATTA